MKITENSQSQFINYVLDFYGQGGIYPLADPIINNKFVERDDVLKAFEKYRSLLKAEETKSSIRSISSISKFVNSSKEIPL